MTLLTTCSAPPHSFGASSTTLLREKDTLVTSQDARSPVTHRKHWRLFVEWVRVVSSIFGYRLIPFSCVAELRIIALEIAFTLAQFFLRVEKRKCSPGQSESNGQSGSQCPPFCLLNLNRKIYLIIFFLGRASNEAEIFHFIHFVSQPSSAVHSQSISLLVSGIYLSTGGVLKIMGKLWK